MRRFSTRNLSKNMMIESNAGYITSPRCVDGSSTGFVDGPAAVGCWFWHFLWTWAQGQKSGPFLHFSELGYFVPWKFMIKKMTSFSLLVLTSYAMLMFL